MRFSLVLLLLASLAGCGPGKSEPAAVASTLPKVGLILGFAAGDNSFNDIQYNGLVRVAQDFPVQVVYRVLEAPSPEGIRTMVDELAGEGCGLVFGGGVIVDQAFPEAAKKHTQVQFVYLDGELDSLPNLFSVTFNQYQGSYLAGALAAKMSRQGRLLFIGGVDLPVIQDFADGFRDGALRANPQVKVETVYLSQPPDFSGYENPDLAYALAQEFFRDRGDVAYAAAGASGLGVIQAAREAGKWSIGVDADQDALAPGNVLTSMMKRLDLVIYRETESWLRRRTLKTGHQELGLAEGGVSLSPMTYTKEMIGEENLAFIQALEVELAGTGRRP